MNDQERIPSGIPSETPEDEDIMIVELDRRLEFGVGIVDEDDDDANTGCTNTGCSSDDSDCSNTSCC